MTITIPTTELIGGLSDVLPIITDPKGSLAGVMVSWDGEALHFTAYDVYSGGTVEWVPGEGAEGATSEDDETPDDEPDWGGDDAAWRTWIWLAQAKEIVKLFNLPAKLWRTPVTMECSIGGDRLIIERMDGPRGYRNLTLDADPSQLKHVADIAAIARSRQITAQVTLAFSPHRLAAFGGVRAHGVMAMELGGENDPVGVSIGTRYVGFIYPAGAKGVRPFNLLRDGAGVHASLGADRPF